MKKAYQTPAVNMVMVETQPLMGMSADTPETSVNHEEYDGVFSSRGGSSWDDED